MAATTYKKYYKITCNSLSSRFHNVLFTQTLSHRRATPIFLRATFSLFNEFSYLCENRLCPVIRVAGSRVYISKFPRRRDFPFVCMRF